MDVRKFQTSWVGRRILPILNQDPFNLMQMDEIQQKINRKNNEGREEYGKDWVNISPQNIESLITPEYKRQIYDDRLSKNIQTFKNFMQPATSLKAEA